MPVFKQASNSLVILWSWLSSLVISKNTSIETAFTILCQVLEYTFALYGIEIAWDTKVGLGSGLISGHFFSVVLFFFPDFGTFGKFLEWVVHYPRLKETKIQFRHLKGLSRFFELIMGEHAYVVDEVYFYSVVIV